MKYSQEDPLRRVAEVVFLLNNIQSQKQENQRRFNYCLGGGKEQKTGLVRLFKIDMQKPKHSFQTPLAIFRGKSLELKLRNSQNMANITRSSKEIKDAGVHNTQYAVQHNKSIENMKGVNLNWPQVR